MCVENFASDRTLVANRFCKIFALFIIIILAVIVECQCRCVVYKQNMLEHAGFWSHDRVEENSIDLFIKELFRVMTKASNISLP